MQDHKNFVADQAFPIISSPSKSDDFYTYDRGMFNRDEMKELAPGARADAANYDITTDNFNAKVYALAKDIADQVRANADEPIKLDSEAAEFLALKVLIHKEVLWTASFFITGIWTEQRTGVASSPSGTDFLRWDVNSSQPIEDMRRAMRAVHSSTGFRPNKMVICRQGYDALLDHPDIIGRLAQGQTPGGPAMTQRENLTALFELEKILVLDSIVNSANEGATNSHDYIGDLNGREGGRRLAAALHPGDPGTDDAIGWLHVLVERHVRGFGPRRARQEDSHGAGVERSSPDRGGLRPQAHRRRPRSDVPHHRQRVVDRRRALNGTPA